MLSIFPSPDEIRALRKKAGLTQEELAKKAGVSQSLIARIEAGTVNPRLYTLIRIMKALEEYVENEITAEAIMSSPLIYATPEEEVDQIVKKMWDHAISQLPVLGSNNSIMGTICERDIIEVFIKYKNKALQLKAKDIMSDPLPMIQPNTKISKITSLLTGDIPAVIVLKDNKPAGIITRSDIMRIYTEWFKSRD
ncbi:MAG: inosine-5-monophosphate dehydrogenase [Thermoprotei archaeon]|nr:MAG: inosine-5-monophosphate dehydrogenase [Thermofilum sp. ex4484_79]RLF07781.1 MAG: inosine-5-monophosphate dehydrogenase [Thermoprotei archaeon]